MKSFQPISSLDKRENRLPSFAEVLLKEFRYVATEKILTDPYMTDLPVQLKTEDLVYALCILNLILASQQAAF